MIAIILMLSELAPMAVITGGAFLRLNYFTEVGSFGGYRTRRSTANEETWKFANRYCGNLWIKCGIAALLPSLAAAFLFTRIMSVSDAIMAVCIMEVIEAALILITVYFVEKALDKRFGGIYGDKKDKRG